MARAREEVGYAGTGIGCRSGRQSEQGDKPTSWPLAEPNNVRSDSGVEGSAPQVGKQYSAPPDTDVHRAPLHVERIAAADRYALQREQTLLQRDLVSSVADEVPAAADHPMARDDDWQGFRRAPATARVAARRPDLAAMWP